MNEDEKKVLTDIYNDLDNATVQLRELARRQPWDHFLRDADSIVTVAMDILEIDMAD